jgi:hypothetical protein
MNLPKTMKAHLILLFAALGLMPILASEAPAAPKGGKLFPLDGEYLEFFVNADHHGEIVIYDPVLKAVSTGDREITVTAGTREKQEKLSVEKGDAMWTTSDLPAGDGYFVIIQVREAAGDAPKTFRLRYVAETCPGCNLPEYACTCEHAH